MVSCIYIYIYGCKDIYNGDTIYIYIYIYTTTGFGPKKNKKMAGV